MTTRNNSGPVEAGTHHDIGYVLRICMVAALGGILFGYDTAVISGGVDSIRAHFGLSVNETGWAVSNVIIGCVIGALGSGWLAGHLGRRKALVVAALLFTVSAVGSAMAETFTWFVIYRMIGGVAVGLASTVSPMYMSEVSPKAMRGRALGMQAISVVGGQVVVFIVNYLIARDATAAWLVDYGWRWMLGSEVIPCVLFCMFVFTIPESPRWQVMVNREDEALKTLTRISSAEHARHLLAEIRESLQQEGKSVARKIDWNRPGVKMILFVGCAIAVLQQVSGINVMLYYAPMVLSSVTGSTESALYQTIWIGVTQLVGITFGSLVIDRVGRLNLMRWGTVGTIVGMGLGSWGMYTQSGNLALTGLLLFVLTFAFSWAVCAWVLISEIFPNHMRSIGMSVSVGSMWTANFLVIQIFPLLNEHPYLVEHFHGAFPMWIFGLVCVFCYWFVMRFVPETSGVSLEHIEEVMLKKIYPNGHPEVQDAPRYSNERLSPATSVD